MLSKISIINWGGGNFFLFGENRSEVYRRLGLFCIPSLHPERREEAICESQEVCSIALVFSVAL